MHSNNSNVSLATSLNEAVEEGTIKPWGDRVQDLVDREATELIEDLAKMFGLQNVSGGVNIHYTSEEVNEGVSVVVRCWSLDGAAEGTCYWTPSRETEGDWHFGGWIHSSKW